MKTNRRRTELFLILVFFTHFCIYSQVTDSSMEKIYSMDLEELMNTKVTIATKSNLPISETPAIVSVITAEEIKNMGARELEDILQMVPGFELNRGYAGYYGIGVRGVKDSRTISKLLIMIDGVPYNQIFYGNGIPWGYDINMDNIERIEIIRGPGSALYGRNAFSGVINIINKDARSNEKLKVNGTLGSYNTKGVSASCGYTKERFSAVLAVRKVKTDVTDVSFKDEYGKDSHWHLNRDNYSIDTKIKFGNFTLTGMYLNLFGGATLQQSKAFNEIGNYSLSYNKNLSPKLFFNFKFYGHNSRYSEDIEQAKPNLDFPLPPIFVNDTMKTYADKWPLGIYYKPQSKEYMYGVESEVNIKLFLNNDLLVGFQADKHGVKDVTITTNFDFATYNAIPNIDRYHKVKYTSGWFVNNGHDYSNIAFLIQDIWKPVNFIGITIGARYDIDSEIGGILNPRTGLVFTPLKNTNVKLLYGKAYRAPSPSEQYALFGYAYGNKDLKAEVINTFEFSVSHKYNNVNQSVSVYVNKLTDMIYAAKISIIDPNNKYYNIGENSSYGIEYENKMIIGKGLYSYLNYSYSISQNKDSANGNTYDHPDVAPHKVNLGINYSFLKYCNFNLNMFYRSKMEKFKIGNTNQDVQDNIGNYAVFNSTFQVNDYVLKGLSLKLSVFNMFNKKYYSQDNQHFNQPPQPGRQILASLIFSIK